MTAMNVVQTQQWTNTDCQGTANSANNATQDLCTTRNIHGVTFSRVTTTTDPAFASSEQFRVQAVYDGTVNAVCANNYYKYRTYKKTRACLYGEDHVQRYTHDSSTIFLGQSDVTLSGGVLQPCDPSSIAANSQLSCASNPPAACVPWSNASTGQASFTGVLNWTSGIHAASCVAPTVAPTPTPTAAPTVS